MECIWQYGGCMMNINWPWIGVIGLNFYIWYSIFTNGFFFTVFWIMVLSSIVGVILRIIDKENV